MLSQSPSQFNFHVVLLYPSCSVRGKRLCRHTVYHFPFSKLPGEGLSFFHSFIHLLRLIEANMKGHLSPLFVWFFSSVSSFFLPGSGVPLRRMANDITWVGTRNISADTSESRLLEPRWNEVSLFNFRSSLCATMVRRRNPACACQASKKFVAECSRRLGIHRISIKCGNFPLPRRDWIGRLELSESRTLQEMSSVNNVQCVASDRAARFCHLFFKIFHRLVGW